MYKKILAAVLAVIILIGAVGSVCATSINDMENQRDQLKQNQNQINQMIEDKQDEIDEQKQRVEAIAAQVSDLNAQVIESRSIVASYDEDIAIKEAEVEALHEENKENMETLRNRLRALYMAGDASSIEIILGASDFTDFIDKVQLVESISEYDAKLVDDIENQLDNISAEVEKINVAKDEQEKEQKKLEEKQSEMNKLLEQHKDDLANLYTQMDEAEDLLHSNKNAQTDLEKKINKYYADQKKQNQSSSKPSSPSTPPNAGASVVVPSTGGYVWPVPGIYTISGAYSENRGSYNHGGVDISGGIMGARVVASASGTVVVSNNTCTHNWGKNGSCGCGGGYGNWVWIDHGNGKATIYAHLTNTVVSVGSRVSAGQLIGYAGSTGWSTGPHLHYECRYYGTKYNPMSEF